MRLEESAFFQTEHLLRKRPFQRWLIAAALCLLLWGGWFFGWPLPITATSQHAEFSSPDTITAQFSPDTALVLISNQTAEIRVNQFPWREFGSGTGVVGRSDSQIREELVTVEIFYQHGLENLPLQRGLTAEIIVTIEEATPAELLWRRLVARTAGG